MSVVHCLYPGCNAILTDPISIARRWGPDHDPDPAARRALTVRLGRVGRWTQNGPDLLDGIDQLPDRDPTPPRVVDPKDLLELLERP